jgi:hypothetical protein
MGDEAIQCIESGPYMCRTETMVFIHRKKSKNMYMFSPLDGPYADGDEPFRIYNEIICNER